MLASPDVEVVVLVSRGPMNVVTPVVMDDPAPGGRSRMSSCALCWPAATAAGPQRCAPGPTSPSTTAPGTDQQWLGRLVVEALDSVHRVEPARISAVNVPLG